MVGTIQNLSKVLERINDVQKRILAENNPSILQEAHFLDASRWYVREADGEDIHLFEKKDTLYISKLKNKATYFSFLEENINFDKAPVAGVEAVKVLPHEEIELQVVGEVTGEMSANLVLVEYTNDKKIVSTLIKLNTTNNIKLSKYTRQIRIALKISGKGLLNLKKMLDQADLSEE